MKFSEEWLREWINYPKITTTELCNKLSNCGIEIDFIKPISGSFFGVVVGKIVNVIPHCKSEKLFVYEVNVGLSITYQVVSSFSNITKNTRIAIALRGSILPKNGIRIDTIFLKGVRSEGIICSFLDLEIENNNKEEKIRFSNDISVGTDVRRLFSKFDKIISISIPPNRSDLLSIFGIARELYLLNDSLKFSNYNIKIIKKKIVNKNLKIELSTNNFFSIKYIGRIIKNVKIQNQNIPFLIRERLRQSFSFVEEDVIENIINYIILEFNQIIHIFDADKISCKKICVRMSNSNDVFFFKNKKINITDNNSVVISNENNEILSLYGILTSDFAKVSLNTRSIFLGSMNFYKLNSFVFSFNPKIDIKNDLFIRLKKGLDYKIQEFVFEYTTKFLIDLLGGEVVETIVVKRLKNHFNSNYISLKFSKINKILGFFIEKDNITNILSRLGYKIIEYKQETWFIEVPTWRFDIKIEEDVIGDIIRIYNYERIPSIILEKSFLFNSSFQYLDSFLERIRLLLVDKGYHEVITYSFINPKIQKILFPDKKNIYIENPISFEMSVMRSTLWVGLLNTFLYNESRQVKTSRLFEIGMCFDKLNEKCKIKQKIFISGLLNEFCSSIHWNKIKKRNDFYDLKGDIESIFEINGSLENIIFRKEKISCLHPGMSAGIYELNNRIGSIGVLHPKIQSKLNLKNSVILFEIFCLKFIKKRDKKIKNISIFPSSRRDISIVVDKAIPVFDIVRFCKKNVSSYIFSVELFDVYTGKNISIDKKSLSLSFFLHSEEKTLKEKDINNIMNSCILKLKIEFQAVLRDRIYEGGN
ncbi:Phenylalanine--tRNA ligase beta subunit [Buchnera aphidicola (Tetraneura ulmi)]|uniref:phenylalanine--tRNA ligase subunit beta n=1 Tax=Buchnera aphidicola TaxID=9 RepID=UPI0034642F4A